FQVLGSLLDDAHLWLSGFVALPDGRLAVDVDPPESPPHEWRWTVSRSGGVALAPCWLAQRLDSQFRWIRGGRGDLLLDGSSSNGAVEILTTAGTSCGTLDESCPGCEGMSFTTRVGLDGTLSYRQDSYLPPSPCEIDWYPGAFR